MYSRFEAKPKFSHLLSGVMSLLLVAAMLVIVPQAGAAEVEKVALLIRELKNDRGEVVPVRDDTRQLIAYFEREAQVKFDVRYYPMPRLLNNVKRGEGIAFGLSKNAERLASLHFSDPIYANYVWLVVRKNNIFPFFGIEDLKGKTVGIIRGVSYGDEFDQKKNSLFSVEEDVSSHVIRLKKLAKNRMDVMLFGARQSDPAEVEALLRDMQKVDQSQSLETAEIEFTVLNKPMSVDELHFAAAPLKYARLMMRLNAAIVRGRKSGDILRILTARK